MLFPASTVVAVLPIAVRFVIVVATDVAVEGVDAWYDNDGPPSLIAVLLAPLIFGLEENKSGCKHIGVPSKCNAS